MREVVCRIERAQTPHRIRNCIALISASQPSSSSSLFHQISLSLRSVSTLRGWLKGDSPTLPLCLFLTLLLSLSLFVFRISFDFSPARFFPFQAHYQFAVYLELVCLNLPNRSWTMNRFRNPDAICQPGFSAPSHHQPPPLAHTFYMPQTTGDW